MIYNDVLSYSITMSCLLLPFATISYFSLTIDFSDPQNKRVETS